MEGISEKRGAPKNGGGIFEKRGIAIHSLHHVQSCMQIYLVTVSLGLQLYVDAAIKYLPCRLQSRHSPYQDTMSSANFLGV